MGGTADRLTIIPISDGADGQSSSDLSARDRDLSARDRERRDEELLNIALERFRSFEVSLTAH